MRKGMSLKLAVVLLIFLVSFSVFAADFPNREVRLVVPIAPGGGADMTMRALARELEKTLKVPVVVENRAGAGGSVGLTEVSKAKPDGYTLVLLSEYIYNLPMTQAVSFKATSFKPIAMVNFDPAAIAVSSKSQFKTIKDLIDYGKSNSGVITVGNSGFGNIWHISAKAFEQATNCKLVHVPFTGAAPTITATLGGHVTAMVASPPEMAAQVAAGNMRILAVMSNVRSKLCPNVPTLKELGYNLQFGTWRGVGVPNGVPQAIIEKLENAVNAAAHSKGFNDFMDKQGFNVLYRNHQETTEYIKNDQPRFRKLLDDMGLLHK
jgi:tripartite-type tricarboxylate transporter receptor subunit TctC